MIGSKWTEVGLLCWDQIVRVCSSDIEIVEFVSSLKHISGIPLVILSDGQHDKTGPSLHVISGSPASLTFEAKSRLLTLRVNWALIEDRPSTLTNLLGQLLSLACADNRMFPLHAAVVSKRGRAYLLLGGAGAGKTNLSVALCKDFGFQWISNDWCTLAVNGDEIEVIHGYDLINFRKRGFNQIASYVPPAVADRIQEEFLSSNTPDTKSSFFTSQDLGLMQGRLPCLLGGIFIVEIGQRMDSYCERISSNQAIEVFLREIFWPLRGLGSFVIDNFGRVVCPSLELTPIMGWEVMCHMANVLIGSYPCYVVKASLKTATGFIPAIVDEHIQ